MKGLPLVAATQEQDPSAMNGLAFTRDSQFSDMIDYLQLLVETSLRLLVK
jgi:hypothetical protein